MSTKATPNFTIHVYMLASTREVTTSTKARVSMRIRADLTVPRFLIQKTLSKAATQKEDQNCFSIPILA